MPISAACDACYGRGQAPARPAAARARLPSPQNDGAGGHLKHKDEVISSLEKKSEDFQKEVDELKKNIEDLQRLIAVYQGMGNDIIRISHFGQR